MTPIRGSGTPLAGRLDDSTALQKRLLQDLERQWLDTWGRTDQMQAQVAPSRDQLPLASEGAPTEGVIAGDGVAGAVSVGVSPKPDVAATKNAPVGSFSHRSGLVAEGVPRASDSLVKARQADSVTMSSVPAGDSMPSVNAGQGRGLAPGSKAARSGQDAEQGPKANGTPKDALGLAPASAPRSPGHDPVAVRVDVINTPAGGALLPGANPSAPQETSTGIAALSPVSMPDTSARASGHAARAALPAAEADAEDARAAKASPRRVPEPAADLKSGPQHLMLRELNDQEILASMRDAQLGSLESQVAAQGLARALMQAGYARVQVVVNGQHQRQASPTGNDLTAGDLALTSQSTSPQSSTLESVRDHGHQH